MQSMPQGRDAYLERPLLQAAGRATDFKSYLQDAAGPGTRDIFFPTNFAALAQLYEHSVRGPKTSGKPACCACQLGIT